MQADYEEDLPCREAELCGAAIVAVLVVVADLASQEAGETSGRVLEVDLGQEADLVVAVEWDGPRFDAHSCFGFAEG